MKKCCFNKTSSNALSRAPYAEVFMSLSWTTRAEHHDIWLRGASDVCLKVSLVIIWYAFSEVSRFFRLPKCAHFGSNVFLRFSRLTSMVFPTPDGSISKLSCLDIESRNYLASHAPRHWPSCRHHNRRASLKRLAISPPSPGDHPESG